MSLISTLSAASQKGFQAPDVVQGPVLKARIQSLTPIAGARFGQSVSIDDLGDRIVIGQPVSGIPSNLAPSYAFIFKRSGNNWTQEDVLSTGYINNTPDSFGEDVTISGDGNYIAVSAPNRAPGYVYIYLRSGTSWSLQKTISNVGGDSVALSQNGDYLAIGQKNYSTASNSRTGRALVYVRSGTSWTLQASLLGQSNFDNQRVGSFIDIDDTGTQIVVGANSSISGDGPYFSTRTGTTWSSLTRINITATNLPQPVSISGNSDYISAYTDSDTTSPVVVGTYIYYNVGTTGSNAFQAYVNIIGVVSPPSSLDTTGGNILIGNRWYSRISTTWSLEQSYFNYSGVAMGYSNSVNSDATYKVFGSPTETVSSLADAGAVYIY